MRDIAILDAQPNGNLFVTTGSKDYYQRPKRRSSPFPVTRLVLALSAGRWHAHKQRGELNRIRFLVVNVQT